jgi:hypothetical protein
VSKWRKDEEAVKKQAGSEAKAKAALDKVGRESLAKLKKEDKRREGDKK